MKYLRLFYATVLFGLILFCLYFVHIKYFKVGVVFYSALLDAILAAFLSMVIGYFAKWLRAFSIFERFQLLCIWLLLGYSFAISVPTVLDRSLSFYILEKLQQRGGGIKLADFDQVFTQEYVKEHRLVDVRLTEQQQSGTIVIQNGCVKLTPWGQALATSSRFFRVNFLPKQRLLMGSYSDDLTDPFRNSPRKEDYLCQ